MVQRALPCLFETECRVQSLKDSSWWIGTSGSPATLKTITTRDTTLAPASPWTRLGQGSNESFERRVIAMIIDWELNST